ncbi:MAG: cell filamentation protein Fic [Desulfuromonadales bacterium]|nr:cell filamentation protein Fic [Desulfuromonadales bacterium]
MTPVPTPTGEFLIYTNADGRIRIETRMQDETVWLNQKQLAELFQTSVPNINMHIRNIYDEGELQPEATIQDFLTVRQEGRREFQRHLTCYNLDLIISVRKSAS